jgi:hypothetical protein
MIVHEFLMKALTFEGAQGLREHNIELAESTSAPTRISQISFCSHEPRFLCPRLMFRCPKIRSVQRNQIILLGLGTLEGFG